MRAFILSVLAGALAASAPFLIFFGTIAAIGIASSDDNLAGVLLLATSPFVLALAIVLPASLFIGLPVTWALARAERESAAAYMLAGAVAGIVLPIIFLFAVDGLAGFPIALLGGVSGMATARTWWVRAREPALYPEWRRV